MTKVVRLKPKLSPSSPASLAEIEAAIHGLAEKHGARAVMTVAVRLLAVTLEAVTARGRPNDLLWVGDLKERLERALAATPDGK